MAIVRIIAAIVAGLIAGVVLIFVCESLSHFIYPPPPGLDPTNREQLAELVATMPGGALILVIVAWAVGSFGGGLVASWIGRERGLLCALVVGVLLLLAGLANLLMLPGHPWWFWVFGLGVFIPAAFAGGRLAGAR